LGRKDRDELPFFRRTIQADITIDAPPERVWRILTDFSAYPEWNPFIRRLEGRPAVGERLRMNLKIPKGWPMRIRPKVLGFEPGASLRWRGRLGVAGLFDGDHRFEVVPAGPRSTQFRQRETFSGALVPLLGAWVAAGALRGFAAMNDALKMRAERL
jgi:hypothetical protein